MTTQTTDAVRSTLRRRMAELGVSQSRVDQLAGVGGDTCRTFLAGTDTGCSNVLKLLAAVGLHVEIVPTDGFALPAIPRGKVGRPRKVPA